MQFREFGRFSHDAATAAVHLQVRCSVIDADTRRTIDGPESFFTVWLDHLMLRGAERWPWPAATNAGFVAGALPNAPLNRGFEFTGQRRLMFNGASEGMLTAYKLDAGPKAVHWGLETGTLEFWCRPSWNADDGVEHIFYKGSAYLYRLQSQLRKRASNGKNQLEFVISDTDRKQHAVRGPAPLKAGQWHHIAATWDLPKAHLQLFVDGKLIAGEGPDKTPWPCALKAEDEKDKHEGIGITEKDKRSLPMQAFIGGKMNNKLWPEGDAAEAVLDEFRISDVVRYANDFDPPREEFGIDGNTRALWHFENERHGVHGEDDRFVRSYLGVEAPPQREDVPFETLKDGKVERRMVVVKPYASEELFEANRGETRMAEVHPYREMPDPRFVEYRRRQVERTVAEEGEEFTLAVEGDYPPLMQAVTFERAKGAPAKTTLLPRWRANDNVVPFSFRSIAETLATTEKTDTDKAIAVMKYVNDVTSYYDAHYCETLPEGLHRPRISYTMLKHLNIYPYDQCGPLNFTLRKIYLAAGISSNNSPGTHHQFQQAFFDGSLRLFDLSSRMYWLNRDNVTVVSLRGVGEDPYCKLRQPGNLNSFYPGRPGRAAFGTAERPHCMDFPLRPGERASVCWVNEGRWFELTGKREPIPMAKVPPFYGNGAVVFEPVSDGEAVHLDNMVVDASALRAKDPAKGAAFVYRARCPYILTDGKIKGRYSAAGAGAITMSLSFDKGKTWTPIWENPDKEGMLSVDMRNHVSARYAYWLKAAFAPGRNAQIDALNVRTTFLNSAHSLSGRLALGKNRVTFVHAKPTVPVKTTCSWVEQHKSDLGVSMNTVSYYNLDYARHRNVLVVPPGKATPLHVTVEGRKLQGTVSTDGVPKGWTIEPGEQPVTVIDAAKPVSVKLTVRTGDAAEGAIDAFDVGVRGKDRERPVPVEVLVANAALVREAEAADEMSGKTTVREGVDVSGRRLVAFTGDGKVAFDLSAPAPGKHALWLRARWELDSPSVFRLRLDDAKSSRRRTHRMIGFYDWTNPGRAYTKGYVHYPKKAEHWAWYRVPDIDLSAAKHRLTLTADAGMYLDTLLVLPQNPAVDRAAMNLFHNWNYAPWQNPL